MTGSCGDCGASEGQYHELGCDLEECPICFGQLISCGCSAQIFDQSLSEAELETQWIAYLEFIRTPFLISRPTKRCPPGASHEELLKLLLESVRESPRVIANGKFHEYPKVLLPEIGTFKIRYCGPRPGRDVSTGEAVTMRERMVPIFEPYSKFAEYLANATSCPRIVNGTTSHTLLGLFNVAVDFLSRTRERQFELPEIGTLKVGHWWKEGMKVPRISLQFFDNFIEELERKGLSHRCLPTT